MPSPAIFAIIGDSLPPVRRAMAFTIQSILKGVPIVLARLPGEALLYTIVFAATVEERFAS